MLKTSSHTSLYPIRIIFYGIIATGVFFALYQYLINRSLWLDEASLALNFIDRSFLELLQPLDYHQVAPIGFLMVEELFTVILGQNEYALRLFPLLCYLASIPIFYRLSKRLLKDEVVVLLATSLFSTTFMLIYYASEVKQYATDVLITTAFLLMTVEARGKDFRYMTGFAIAGGLAIWFSNTAIIVLFASGVYLFVTEILQRRKTQVLLPFSIWAISFAVYFVLFIQGHPTQAHMRQFWGVHFLPLNPLSTDFYLFIFKCISRMYQYPMGLGHAHLAAMSITLIGLIDAVHKKNHVLVYLSIAIVGTHLFLSGLHLYPFSGRLVLYLTPMFTIAYTAGLYSIFKAIQQRIPRLPEISLVLPALCMIIPLAFTYPREREQIKQTIRYIEEHKSPDDNVYVYSSSSRAFSFYQKTGFTTLGNEVIIGSWHRGENSLYDQELLNLKGKVWMLFSHVYPSASPNYNEETYMIGVLLSNGAQIIDTFQSPGSTCYYINTGKEK